MSSSRASDDKGHSAVISCRVEPEFDAQMSRLSQLYRYPTRGDFIREALSEGAKVIISKHEDDPESYSWVEEFEKFRKIKLMMVAAERRRDMVQNLITMYNLARSVDDRTTVMSEMKALSTLPGMEREFDYYLSGTQFDY